MKPVVDKTLGELQVEISDIAKDVKIIISEEKDVEKRLKAVEDGATQIALKAEKLDEWLRDVDGKVGRATRSTAVPDTGNILAAIPKRMRITPSLWERTGCKPDDAVRRSAIEAWFKNVVNLHNPARRSEYPELMKEIEALEQAFGYDADIKGLTKAALAEGTGNVGGFTVPTPLEAEVLRVMEDEGVVRGLARKIPMTVFKHLIPNLQSGVTINLVAEAGTIGDSLPATPFGQSSLEAKMFAGLATVAMQLVADNAIGLMGFLTQLFGEKTALLEDTQALEGTGAGINFTGLAAASGTGSVLNGGTAALPTFPKLIEIKWKGRKRGTRRGAAWIMAPEHAANCEKLVDSQNRPIWSMPVAGNMTVMVPASGVPSPPDGILLGYPLYAHAELLTNRTQGGASNCSNLYFGPFGHGMIFGDLLGMQFGVSEHVNWTTGQLSLRMLKRTAILVGVAGDFTVGTEFKIA